MLKVFIPYDKMPQIFQVLRCYKCLVFQVHQTKKSIKFQCKMCGEKQSLKRHYGLGNGQECRLHVQKLNGIRGQLSEEKMVASESSEEEFDHKETKSRTIQELEPSKSKWSIFVDNEDNIAQDDGEIPSSNNDEIPSQKPKRRKKNNTTQNLIQSSSETSVNRRKFETPFKTNENINKIIQVKSYHETNVGPMCNQKYNPFPNKLNSVQSSVKENSKWTQFVDHQENSQEPVKLYVDNDCTSSKTNNLFELCDDADLDDILNI